MPAPLPAPVPAPTPAPAASPAPIPVPTANTTPLPLPVNDPETTLSGIADEKGYSDLWAKRSEKPLQQIYGHIDRISNKEAGSLLDRYADRFGHSLDREIIVMRKAAVDEKVAEIRDAPVVELIEDEPATPADELKQVEDELRDMVKQRFEDPNVVEKTLSTLRDSVRLVTTLFDNVRKKNHGES